MESVSPFTLSRQTHTTRAVVQGWLSDRVREPSNPEFSLFKCYLWFLDNSAVPFDFRGCSFSPCHVWSGLPSTGGIFGPLEGFVRTKVFYLPPFPFPCVFLGHHNHLWHWLTNPSASEVLSCQRQLWCVRNRLRDVLHNCWTPAYQGGKKYLDM